MNPIKFIEDDGTVRVINPIHITDVKAIPSTTLNHNLKENEWCIVINVARVNGTPLTYTKVFENQEACMACVDEIIEKMSI